MIIAGKQPFVKLRDLNKEYLSLNGDLEDSVAKSTLSQFLIHNPGFTWEFLTGNKLFPYQEVLLRTWLAKNFNMNIISRGGAKCIKYTDDNFIIDKENGLISITEFIKDINFDGKDRWNSILEKEIWTGTKWHKIDKYLTQNNKRSYRIETKKGYCLTGSENHLVKAINIQNNKCNIVWKRFYELNINDYICIDRNQVELSDVATKSELEEAYLIGLLLGDGCICKKANPIITTSDQEIIDFCNNNWFVTSVFNDKRGLAKGILLKTDVTNKLLEKYKIKKCKSYFKEIPNKIISNKLLLKECLSALFDTDGCATQSKQQVEFCSTSIKMARQVHLLLLQFGIISKFFERKTDSLFGKAYKVILYGKNAKLFGKLIGFKIKRKREVLDSFSDLKCNTNEDIIPGSIDCIYNIKKLNKKQKGEANGDYLSGRPSQFNLSYDKVQEAVHYFDRQNIYDVRINDLKTILNQNYFFDKIVKKEEEIVNCIDFNIPDEECYWSNGFISHNTYLVSVFCTLFPIFEPNTQIVIASSGFRRSRSILEQMDVFLKADGADLLRQCYPHDLKRKNDEYRLAFGEGGYVVAIPLNENARGFRGQVLVCDEGLLISEEMFRAVLMPFIVARSGIKEVLQIKEIEEYLVKKGLLKEENKEFVKSTKKIIMLSSASFKFQFLYNLYEEWIKKIIDGIKDDELKGSYFVGRLGYKALPEELIDSTVINEAKSGGMSQSLFQREYEALFVDDSSGFYSAARMNACTILDGEFPCVELKADVASKYILTLDSNLSESQSSDHHAMSVFKLNPAERSITLVHAYAKAGKSFKEYAAYFYYLLSVFKPVLVWVDKTGGGERFVMSANETTLFKDNNLKINKWDADFEQEDYPRAIRESKRTYNYENKNILYGQHFTTETIGKMADTLQVSINNKKIWFASRITSHADAVEQARTIFPDFIFAKSKEQEMIDLLDELDDNITLTKNEAALIEVSVTPLGARVFNLPQHLRRSDSITRARRDSYTCLKMGTYAAKIWFDRMDQKEDLPALKPCFIR